MVRPLRTAATQDLAANQPGANVAAEAKALRDAAPVRTFFERLVGAHTEERSWRVGAKGERLVADQLERLPPSWHTLHSIRLSETGTDLDHLVVGPGGILSVNTKHHPDAKVWVAGETFLVNGQRQSYIRASRSEGKKVARLLSAAYGSNVDVTPVIAVVGAAGGFELKEPPVGVVVCPRRALAGWLWSLPSLLSPKEVDGIFSVARLPGTWTSTSLAEGVLEGNPARGDAHPHRAQATPRGVAGTKLLITYSQADGLRLFGDPRPHQGLVKAAGFHWSARQQYWYLPDSRGKPLASGITEELVAQLRGLGFSVESHL